jgi:hypothetical protein
MVISSLNTGRILELLRFIYKGLRREDQKQVERLESIAL